MPTTLDYAQLSLRAYAASRDNRTPLPSGWTEIEWIPDQTSGFSAGAYQKGNEIVISYTGTNERLVGDIVLGNLPLYSGEAPSPQVPLAMLLYLRVKATFPAASVSFTGHSMGGGLASMMAVFFDRPAQVFDAAPFEQGARSWLGTCATAVAALGYSDPEFDSYRASVSATFAAREWRVQNRFIAGEFVNLGRFPGTEIGTSHPEISVGTPTDVSAFNELHSMAVLASMLTSAGFADAVRARPALLDMMFDPALYFNEPTNGSRDLLRHLYGSQVHATSSAPLLDRFAADLLRIDASEGMTGQASVQKALTVAAMEYYYYDLNAPATATQLFTAAEGGLHFNYADIGRPQIGLKSPRLLAAAMQPFLSPEEWANVGYKLDTQGVWHIQSGADGMTWTASAAAYDVAVGGASTDVRDGGVGDDILIGGAGADFLSGGADNDILAGGLALDVLDGGTGNYRLLGGAGVDVYRFSGTFGSDTIEDSSGDGVIELTGVGNLSGAGAKKTSPNSTTWQTDDKQVTYSLVQVSAAQQNLVITVASAAHVGSITIRNWADGQLGIINLGADVFAPQTTATYTGNFLKASSDGAYTVSDGNYAGSAVLVDAQDVLNGGAFADHLQGFGGNDGLAGGDEDDLIEGGAGDDLLLGGAGADILNGGAGDDFIFGSGTGAIATPSDTGFTPPVASGTVYARGFSWVVFDGGTDSNGFQTVLVGGANPATVAGDAGKLIDGGAGNDFIFAGSGADVVHGGDDHNTIGGLGGADVLFGDAGNDKIVGDGIALAGYSRSVGAAEYGSDILVGGAGNDRVGAGSGADIAYGGEGDDTLVGMGGADVLLGDAGAELFLGTGGRFARRSTNCARWELAA